MDESTNPFSPFYLYYRENLVLTFISHSKGDQLFLLEYKHEKSSLLQEPDQIHISFLEYYRIPYKAVEGVTWSDGKKKPNVALDGELMFDSSDIIDKLIKRIHPDYDLNAEEEKKWREWVDNHLVHAVFANIYRNVPETLEAVEYNTSVGNLNSFNRLVIKYSAAVVNYFRLKKLKNKHNITDERAALHGAAEQWVDALNGRKFLGGLDPNLADLAVFAILYPILPFQSGRDMVEQTRIAKWLYKMDRAYEDMKLRLS